MVEGSIKPFSGSGWHTSFERHPRSIEEFLQTDKRFDPVLFVRKGSATRRRILDGLDPRLREASLRIFANLG